MLRRIQFSFLVALQAILALPILSGIAGAAVFQAESRDSLLVIDPVNLGYEPGFVGAPPEDLLVSSTNSGSLSSLAASGLLYYGPDLQDRVNFGDYLASQDIFHAADELSVTINSAAMISLSEASPQISITNDLDFFFSVDEDVEGWVQITFDGDSNTGSDAVGLRITPVDSAGNATGPYLLWLFADVAFSGGTIDPLGDTYGRPISLVGGQRYRFANSSRAIVNDGGLARSSYFDTRLSVPEPGGEALMAGIGFLALLATASLKERRMAA